jgi:hypothetical protein
MKLRTPMKFGLTNGRDLFILIIRIGEIRRIFVGINEGIIISRRLRFMKKSGNCFGEDRFGLGTKRDFVIAERSGLVITKFTDLARDLLS